MIRILMLVFTLVVFTVPAGAERLSVDGLTEEQVADLMLKAAKMKALPETNVTEQMSEWAAIGQKYGMALAATAKELGVAADELLDTTVGKVALVLIIWKVMGSDFLGIVIGIPYLIIGFCTWFYAFRRASLIESVTVEPVEGKFWRKKTIEYKEGTSEEAWLIRWAYFGVLMVAVCGPAAIMIFSG